MIGLIKTDGKLSCTVESGKLIIKLKGEIDHHSAQTLRQSADELIYRYRPISVVLDLSEIDFMDSSGLGFIMGRYALQKKLGGSVTVKDPNVRIRKIIALAGLERIIKIERTSEQ